MVAFAFLAVLADRPAITLRALALAATVILLLRPISLMDVGFQMSFAATVALVAGFELLRNRSVQPRHGTIWQNAPRLLALYVGGILLSSLLAGLATAPYAAFHFNRTAPYGLLSNLLALPIMGAWIAPWACLAGFLAPFGLADPALRAMGLGIEAVLTVAHWVADLPGAVQPARAAPEVVLALITLGGLWLALWRGPWRLGGIAGLAAGLIVWSTAPPRPDLLIAPDARLVGVLGPAGRVLDHPRAQGFAAQTWLRRDGDPASQDQAAGRPGLARRKRALSADLPDNWRLEVLWDRRPKPESVAALCQEKTILIVRNGPHHNGLCHYYGASQIAAAGAIAVTFLDGQPVTRHSRTPGHGRLWDQAKRTRRSRQARR